MKVHDAMTSNVRIASVDQTLQDAARMMQALDAGALPVSDKDQLVGMITDRDIAIRGIAEGKGPDAKVRDVMTRNVKYCFEDQELDEVTHNMADIQVRRLPVIDREKRLVGIISLADIALTPEASRATDALCGISRRGGEHTQSGHQQTGQHQR